MSALHPVGVRFGENIRRYRKAAGWSQEALGFHADLHRTYIGILERGEGVPRIETVIRLAGALGVTVYDLLDGIEWRPGHVRQGGFTFEAKRRGWDLPCGQMSGIDAGLIEAALQKLKNGETPGNIAAVFIGEAGPPDLDGVRWRLVVTDGDGVEEIDADLSGSQGGARGMTVDSVVVEGAVELRAINAYPIESRLSDLVAASPLILRAEDLRL